ncbi:ATPase [Clostridium carboxidivorans P7]|nr:heavy metal translocating P-type ATPase [Clostridium carboxidivorans]AKN34181.1 ATPase [Clostridium carboxidivorans P7]EFG87276.1 cadmium-translocating P-type ATPase [Clostridium carboxidivorans P7]
MRKEFVLEGLGCANCAAKMERNISRIEGITNVSVDFMRKSLALEIEEISRTDELIAAAEKIVKNIESQVIMKEKMLSKELAKEKVHDNEEHAHNHNHEEGLNKKELIQLSIGAAVFVIASIFEFSFWMEAALYIISYILIGGEVVVQAFKNIVKGQVFDENFLMSIATIGAFSIQQFPEAVAVMLFYQVGELFQDAAVNNSRKSISSLMNIRPDFANLKLGDEVKKVKPEEVNIGDLIVVTPGEKVPLDGTILEGKSMLDTSALTGESVPREAAVGDTILGGFINKNGLLTIKVTKEFSESTVAKILNLVENASSKKAPTEKFITKFARYYTPVVVVSAVLLAFIPPLVISDASFSEWIYRALVFLVVSCPCALVISIPLGFFGGIGGASKNGILIKGGNYLEALNNVEMVVFDKTGTLTKGTFKVTEIEAFNEMSKEEILEYAAFAESYSNHPIATSILKAYGKEINKSDMKNYEEISGHGIRAEIRGKQVLCGNAKLMEREKIQYDSIDTFGTVVFIAIDKKYAGHIVISDEIKEDSKMAIQGLKSIGIKKTIMLTGDNSVVGSKVGQELGVDEVYSELLPQDKVEKLENVEKEKSSKGKLVFVGDGINDAPVLARADIGIAMGGLGSDAAIEAADVVIMTDEPSKIVTAIKIAKRTKSIVMQNIVFALGVKAIILVLGALGIANMWEAVFGDVGVAVIAILNSMRALKVKK